MRTTRATVLFGISLLTGLLGPTVAAQDDRASREIVIASGASAGRNLGFVGAACGRSSAWADYAIVSGNERGTFAIDRRRGELFVRDPSEFSRIRDQTFDLTIRRRHVAALDFPLRAFAADLLETGVDGGLVTRLLEAEQDFRIGVRVSAKVGPGAIASHANVNAATNAASAPPRAAVKSPGLRHLPLVVLIVAGLISLAVFRPHRRRESADVPPVGDARRVPQPQTYRRSA